MDCGQLVTIDSLKTPLRLVWGWFQREPGEIATALLEMSDQAQTMGREEKKAAKTKMETALAEELSAMKEPSVQALLQALVRISILSGVSLTPNNLQLIKTSAQMAGNIAKFQPPLVHTSGLRTGGAVAKAVVRESLAKGTRFDLVTDWRKQKKVDRIFEAMRR